MTSTSGSEEIGLEKQDVWIYVCILLLCLDRAMDPDYVAGAWLQGLQLFLVAGLEFLRDPENRVP